MYIYNDKNIISWNVSCLPRPNRLNRFTKGVFWCKGHALLYTFTGILESFEIMKNQISSFWNSEFKRYNFKIVSFYRPHKDHWHKQTQKYWPSMSISFSMRFNSSEDGNCPRFLITVPNSSVVIDPSPSLSKSRKASLSSELEV